jgi:hypothetical protein
MISRLDDLRPHLQQQADDGYADTDDIPCTKLQRNVKTNTMDQKWLLL